MARTVTWSCLWKRAVSGPVFTVSILPFRLDVFSILYLLLQAYFGRKVQAVFSVVLDLDILVPQSKTTKWFLCPLDLCSRVSISSKLCLLTSKHNSVTRVKCWHLTFLQTTDMFVFLRVICYVPYWPFCALYHVHIACLSTCFNTWRWTYRPRGSQVSDRSSSLCLNIWEKPLDIFDVIQQHFNICKHERHWIFWREVGISPAVFVETETGILKQTVSFPNSNQVLFFLPKPSLSISTALWCYQIKKTYLRN